MNILTYNWKGGCAKSTISSIIASYLDDSKLLEIDFINKSDKKLNTEGYYESEQINFVNETSDAFYEFENQLLDDGVKVIDCGAVMLDKLHSALKTSNLYSNIDLIVLPAMDGADDFNVAYKFLTNIKGLVDPTKIIIAFNRFDPIEYNNDISEQFETFFNNKKLLKDKFGIDLDDENSYFVIKNSKAIKKSRAMGIVLKSLIDQDIKEITDRQRAEKDGAKRLIITKERGLVQNAHNLYSEYISPMLEKIAIKLEQ
ncbi:MAG: hypothetical protein WA945_10285 [Arcobacteraceae bacterium]